jgi:hypothetical protein
VKNLWAHVLYSAIEDFHAKEQHPYARKKYGVNYQLDAALWIQSDEV